MKNYNSQIRKIIKNWLKGNEVDLVIGYKKGKEVLRAIPCFARTPDEADQLVFDRFCYQNLAAYLREHRGSKIGIVVKGCDGKALVELIKEKQIDRSKVKILTVACDGIFQKKKLQELLGNNHMQIDRVVIDNDTVHFCIGAEKISALKKDILATDCLNCKMHISPIYDHVVGETDLEDQESEGEPIQQPPEERWKYFQEQMNKCIRCYACRDVCPMCGCELCFVDRNQPQWVGRTTDESDNMVFHLTRALHMAGRCVSCGACTQACPTGVDLNFLSQRLKRTVKQNFNYEPGTDKDSDPVLQTYNTEDPDDFIE